MELRDLLPRSPSSRRRDFAPLAAEREAGTPALLLALPNEIIHKILLYLDSSTLLQVQLVSHSLREAASHDLVWRPLLLEPHPSLYASSALVALKTAKETYWNTSKMHASWLEGESHARILVRPFFRPVKQMRLAKSSHLLALAAEDGIEVN